MIIADLLAKKAKQYMNFLCYEIPTRQVGSAGNRAATNYFENVLAGFGWRTSKQSFDCIDWNESGAELLAQREPFHVYPSPYSLGCRVSAPLVTASTLAELEALQGTGSILMVYGELTKEQLMPKNFPFYNPENHQQIYRLLESKKPLAIIAATSRNPELVGGVYPFPWIEDGDFDIPSVYMTEDESQRLIKYAHKQVSLEIRASRITSVGWNIVGQKGNDLNRRIVLSAHIDAKIGTPGALDNASGIVVLLLLAELLAQDNGQRDTSRPGLEIVAFNGEDYYSAAGEIAYLRQKQRHTQPNEQLANILLNVNLDGVGYIHGKTAYSLYECPADLDVLIQGIFASEDGMLQGEQWYQGDHMIFVQNKIPALAILSERGWELFSEITHTVKDTPELVDSQKLANIAMTLGQLLSRIPSINYLSSLP